MFLVPLTQIFPLQGFSLPLLGVDQSIFGDHLNKQLLQDRNEFRSHCFKTTRQLQPLSPEQLNTVGLQTQMFLHTFVYFQ